jgi:rubrerythrin
MTKLSEIIEFAIEREIEAETFYLEVAAKTTKEGLRGLFVGFAGEEKRHQQMLKEVLNSGEAQLQVKKVEDYNISETIEKAELSDTMTIADVFSFAIKKEEEAMQLYQQLATDATTGAAKELFESLVAMEQGHKVKMEEFYTDVAYNEVW